MGLFSRKKEKSHHEIVEELSKRKQTAIRNLSIIVSDSVTTQTTSMIDRSAYISVYAISTYPTRSCY